MRFPVPIRAFVRCRQDATTSRGWISLVALASSAALVSVPAASAAPGDLDPGFGTDGTVVTDLGSARGSAVAIQSNGKIVVAGQSGYPISGFALARYLPDGSLDPVFDGDGIVTTDFGAIPAWVSGLAIQADGKIVAAGSAGGNFAIARYRRDGGLDTTFSDDGKVTVNLGAADEAADLAIQPDGKIVLCGSSEVPPVVLSNFALARLSADGSLDPSFGGDGTVITDFATPDSNSLDWAYGVALQSDGRIVAAGTAYGAGAIDFALARYETDGSLDPTFDGDGKVTTDLANGSDHANSVALQTNGKIVAAGYTSSNEYDFALVRYNPDGSLDARGDGPLDTSFGSDGKVVTDFPHPPGFGEYASAVAIQQNGSIVAAGSALGGFALARYAYDGSLDQGFGTGGLVTTAFEGYALSDAAIQADGAIVAVGTAYDTSDFGFALARYVGDVTVPPGQGVPPGAP